MSRNQIKDSDLPHLDGYPELNKFLIHFYEYDQYKILQQVYTDIGWILRNSSDLDTDEIIDLIDNIFNWLDTDLLVNEKYIKLINSYFEPLELDQKINNPSKNLDEKFWREFSKYLPKELQKGFIYGNNNSKSKNTSIKQIKEFREIIVNFLLIEKQYLEIKKTLLLCVDSVLEANKKINNFFPANKDFINFFPGKNLDKKAPLVKIDIDEIDRLTHILNTFGEYDEISSLKEIEKIFIQA